MIINPPHFPSSQSACDSGCGSDLSVVIRPPDRFGGRGRTFQRYGLSDGTLQDQIPEPAPVLKNAGVEEDMESSSQEASATLFDMGDKTKGPTGIGGNEFPFSNFGSSVCSDVGTWFVAVTVSL